ncbi:hypothetical protein BD626DRAFT_509818 [Schizophyllum amplum]|uniref:Uncharacterized protein n=1 Tax=Schizophyllum amplum TaxID=97359 RepID=A0A550C258_9AGAR|nr:hypothetical protein BD626DRAFT_509818 [Auriculariopsis ampla]
MPQRALTTLQQAASVFHLDLQREGFVPSPEEAKAIQDHSDLLLSEIGRLDAILHDLATAREKLIAQVDVHRSLTSPVHRLFPELLSEIFLKATESQLTSLDPTNMPRTIARVSTTWRRVARATPRLWTHVVATSASELDKYIDLYFNLSLECPLDMHCRDHRLLLNFWSRLGPYAQRWRSVRFVGNGDVLRDLGHVHAAHLESLYIDAFGGPFHAKRILNLTAPRLQRLAVHLVALDTDCQTFLQPTSLKMLATLVINVIYPFPATYVLPVLRLCAATLVHVEIDVIDPQAYEQTFRSGLSMQPLSMHSLKRIDLSHSACAIFYHITAPKLEVIKVTDGVDYLPDAMEAFTTRTTSPSRIRLLEVDINERADVTHDGVTSMIHVLERMDNLEELRISSFPSPNPDAVLECLVCRGDTPPLVSNLREFEYADYQSLDLLLEVYRTRKEERIVQGKRVAALSCTYTDW